MFNLSKVDPEVLTKSILDRCKSIDEKISLEVPEADIDGLVGKLNTLSSMTGTISASFADAKRLLRHKQLLSLTELTKSSLSPSTLNKMLDAECGDEEALFAYCDRLRSGLTSTMESLVTLISLWKAEYANGQKEVRVFKKQQYANND